MNIKELRKKCGFREDYNFENKFELKTRIKNYIISTVDLGVNISLDFNKPLYYETMIFKERNKKINFEGLYCERYATEEEAKTGHKKAIKYIKEKLKISNF